MPPREQIKRDAERDVDLARVGRGRNEEASWWGDRGRCPTTIASRLQGDPEGFEQDGLAAEQRDEPLVAEGVVDDDAGVEDVFLAGRQGRGAVFRGIVDARVRRGIEAQNGDEHGIAVARDEPEPVPGETGSSAVPVRTSPA